VLSCGEFRFFRRSLFNRPDNVGVFGERKSASIGKLPGLKKSQKISYVVQRIHEIAIARRYADSLMELRIKPVTFGEIVAGLCERA